MSTLKSSLIFTIFSVLVTNSVLAAQDYNSSRSNRTLGIAASDETDTLLKKASSEASSVTKSMVAADQADGYSGDYIVTVDVRVTIERYTPGDRPPVIRSIRKR